jgi:hypothetical protein
MIFTGDSLPPLRRSNGGDQSDCLWWSRDHARRRKSDNAPAVQASRRIAYGLADGFYPVEKTKWEKTAA